MRAALTFVGVTLGVLLGIIIGYRLAAHHYAELNLAREDQLRREIALLFTVVVDIAEHQKDGQTEVAQWKFTELRNGLEHYLRGGGPDPTEFVPDIVEVTQIPSQVERAESD